MSEPFKCLSSTSLKGECPMMFHSCHELGYTSCPRADKPQTEREFKKDTDAQIEFADAFGDEEC